MANLFFLLSLVCTVSADSTPIRWLPPGEVLVIAVERECMTPLSGLTVTLHRDGAPSERDAVVVSGSDGRARFERVVAGKYTISLELSGFAAMKLGPFLVRAGEKDNPRIPEFLAVMNPEMWVDYIEVMKRD